MAKADARRKPARLPRQVLAAIPMIDPRRVRPGMPVEFVADTAGGATTAILFKLAIDRHVRATRVDSQSWTAREETLPWITDTIVVRGAVANNLYDALHGEADQLFPGSSHNGLVYAIADVYKFRVDMSRELRKGDSVHAVIEGAGHAPNLERSAEFNVVLARFLDDLPAC